MSLLIVSTLLSAVLSNGTDPRALQLELGAGTTLSSTPQGRILADLAWYPFPVDAWGGLGSVAGVAMAGATVGPDGNGIVGVAARYGRPRDTLWVAFDAGLACVVGSTHSSLDALVTATGSLKLAYSHFGLRVMAMITSSDRVLHRDYYSLTLEWTWGP